LALVQCTEHLRCHWHTVCLLNIMLAINDLRRAGVKNSTV